MNIRKLKQILIRTKAQRITVSYIIEIFMEKYLSLVIYTTNQNHTKPPFFELLQIKNT